MTHDLLDGGVPGRSTLRRGRLDHRGRRRPYLGRWIAAIGAGLAIGGPVYLVEARLLPMTGPLSLLYTLHDRAWLTLRGHLWTALFPQALAWLIPLVVLSGIALVEWLTPAGTTRLHRRAVLLWHRLGARPGHALPPIDPRVLAGPGPDDAAPRRADIRHGFRARVARNEWQGCWRAARRRHLDGAEIAPQDARRMAEMAVTFLRLSPADPRAVLALAESMALLPGPEGVALARALHDALVAGRGAQDTTPPAFELLGRLAEAIATDPAPAPGDLVRACTLHQARIVPGQALPDRLALAAACIALGWAAGRAPGRAAPAQHWFDGLATRRIAAALPAPTAETLSEAAEIDTAMALVDMPLWAGQAERGATPRAAGGWLAGFSRYPDGAEIFAAEGRLP
ncbi:hypothetical protein [Mesobacterium pallidum]|uniref:hypothetical protein n=1 Tax=Mesobacterium pallidum TaxID=2872037 RepID=UPI001EE2EF68|nr:hypothetical protein [Mesobacterium pallidum]